MTTRRILYYLNASNPHRPQTDSGVILANEVLLRLIKWNPEWHFYVVCPPNTPLPEERCTPIYIPYINYNMFGRSGFDLYHLWKFLVDDGMLNKYDFDTIFCNQPEVSQALFTLINNHPRLTCTIPIINYFHWFVNEDTYQGNAGQNMEASNQPMARLALVGAMTGQATMVNSQWEKDFILKDARTILSPKDHDWLEERMFIGNPGVNIDDCQAARTDEKFDKFTILWNNRLSSYTGAAEFFEWCDLLWSEGYRDFQVVATNVANKIFAHRRMTKGSGEYPDYLKIYDHLPHDEYHKLMWKCDASVFMHKGWGAWSMASLEMMACERPVISVRDRAAPEIFGDDYPLFFTNKTTDKDAYRKFKRKILMMIDDPDLGREVGKKNYHRALERFDWDNTVKSWDSVIKKFGDFDLSNNPSTEKMALLEKVRKAGSLSKHELLKHFGGAISWTRYRRFLLSHGVYDNYKEANVTYHSTMPEGGFTSMEDEWDELF